MTSEVGISNISFINFQDDDQTSVDSPQEDANRSGMNATILFKFF